MSFCNFRRGSSRGNELRFFLGDESDLTSREWWELSLVLHFIEEG